MFNRLKVPIGITFNQIDILIVIYCLMKTPEELRLNETDINNQPSATVLDLMRKPRLRRTTILLTLLWLVQVFISACIMIISI